ncbi:hypothetical protein V7x_24490 [Crateriforma conspicua]|uniref:Uncharacterized protein n=1 Tax=Crateriforma conspicua TaxID=2527996 RepID=A0A5C6FZT2_9PLAN|nr:hypothetical protein V7x_24490 [Crateriforma conspicua]
MGMLEVFVAASSRSTGAGWTKLWVDLPSFISGPCHDHVRQHVAKVCYDTMVDGCGRIAKRFSAISPRRR